MPASFGGASCAEAGAAIANTRMEPSSSLIAIPLPFTRELFLRLGFRLLRYAFLFGDEHVGDDADVRLPPVAALDRSVVERHGAVAVHRPAALRVGGDAAHQRHDLRFLIELDLLLTEPAFDVRPAEQALVDRAERGEVAVPDVVLLREVGEARHDFVALGHADPVGPGAFAEIGHLHPRRETFARTRAAWHVSFSRWRLRRRLRRL